jgi:hypothetical protein
MHSSTNLLRHGFSGARATVLALTMVSAAAPVCGQQLSWVGLSGHEADLLVEQGSGPDAGGPADHFGFSVAAGDFNADGVDDLAIGVPNNDCDSVVWDCGSIAYRFGIRGLGLGLSSHVLRQPIGVPEGGEAGEQFGYALATGDFDGNGADDLVVGTPGNKIESWSTPGERIATGSTDVHFGTATGLTNWSVEYRPGSFGLPGVPSYLSRFGASVAMGDFDGDGRDDIAVGAPDDSVPGWNGFSVRGGSVMVFGRDAIGNVGGYEMMLGDQGLPDEAEEGEKFGKALAAGDFNHDGYDDLAIGVPREDDIGAVLVVYGSQWSLLFANHLYIGEWDLGEPAEPGDLFGDALAAGDFNGDGYDDLAIGAPEEDGGDGVPSNMGLVGIAYGSAGGLLAAHPPVRLYEHMLYGSGSEANDYFGAALAAGDFNGDGYDDLAIGTEGEDNGVTDSGAVSIVLGTALGLPGAARVARPTGSPAGMIPDGESGSPYYGFAVAAGDFDGNGFSDLAVGGPNQDRFGAGIDSGAVAVLYGHLFVDGFENGLTNVWSRVATP